MSEIQFQTLFERVSATAIANQAILKCLAFGMPLTVDNVILFVGDFFDPNDPAFGSIILKISDAIVYVVEQNEEDPEAGPDHKSVIRLFS